MRLFYAVLPSREEQGRLHKIQKELLTPLTSYRATGRENLHLTLHFLGEKSEEQLPELRELLDDVVSGVEPFLFSFREVGFFQKKNQKILWLGPGRGEDKLKGLWERMGKALELLEHEVDPRPFRPHLTLARQVRGDIGEKEIQPVPVHVDALHLMESKQVEGRLVYRSIYRAPLG